MKLKHQLVLALKPIHRSGLEALLLAAGDDGGLTVVPALHVEAGGIVVAVDDAASIAGLEALVRLEGDDRGVSGGGDGLRLGQPGVGPGTSEDAQGVEVQVGQVPGLPLRLQEVAIPVADHRLKPGEPQLTNGACRPALCLW